MHMVESVTARKLSDSWQSSRSTADRPGPRLKAPEDDLDIRLGESDPLQKRHSRISMMYGSVIFMLENREISI